MTPGRLETRLSEKGTVWAEVGPDGWSSNDDEFANALEVLCPPPSTECGVPWVKAFWSAVDLLGADVVDEPEPDPWPGSSGSGRGDQNDGSDGETLNTLVANLAADGMSVDDIQDAIDLVVNFDPDQARDDSGKWTAGGGGGGKGLVGRLFERIKRAVGAGPKEDVRVEGQRDFAHPHESKAVQDILSGAVKHDLHAGLASSREDTALTAIMKEAGRTGKPRLASADEIDELGKKGWYVAYRGTGQGKFAEQFKAGEEMYNGAGSYGNGSYFTYTGRAKPADQARAGAQMYAAQNSQDGKGAVTRIAFPPGARIADWESLRAERNKYVSDLSARRFKGQLSKEDYEVESKLHEDLGRFAAMRNYDAIRVRHDGFLVVLNRNKVVAQRD